MNYTEAQSKIADLLYTTYCNSVGGKAYDGKPLPTWNEFVSDPTKAKQCNAWHDVAITAFEALAKK